METNRTKIPKAIGAEGMKIYDTLCVTCLTRNTVSNGQYHCKYCGVMCEECSSNHQKMPKKGHWAMKLKRVSQPIPLPTFKSFTKCEFHTSEKIGGYCIDCGELLCKACIEDKHAACDTQTIDNMCFNVSREKNMREARLELEDLRVRNNRARKSKMAEMKFLSKQADDFMNKVVKVREKVLAMFDNLLGAIVKDKNAFCTAEAEVIERHVIDSKNLSPVFESAKLKLNEAYKTGNNANLWIAMKKLERVVTHYDKIVSDIEADKCDVNFEFIPSASLAGLLQETENIGSMKVTSSRIHKVGTNNFCRPTGKKMALHPKRHVNAENTSPHFKSTNNSVSKILNAENTFPHFKSTNNSVSKILKLPAIKSSQETGTVQLKFRPLSRSSNRSKSMDTIDLRPKKLTSRDRTGTSMYAERPAVPRYKRKKNPSKLDQFDEEMEGQVGEEFGEMRDIKLSVIGKKEIAVPEEHIENCITGCTFLRNGRLVLVDYNNKTLKLYTADFNLVTCLFVEDRPWDVTGYIKTDIAVSFPFVNTVEIYETGSDFKYKGKITVDRKCHGLAFQRQEKLLYVACGEGLDARLQAYSLEGFVRRVIIPKEGVLHEPCFLTIPPDGARVFVSDLDNGVVGFDTYSGDMVCQYRDPKVKRYWGLTSDLHGHVFVVTTDPDCLYVLMGDHNGQLLTSFEGDKKVCAVCYDPVTNSIVISRWKSDEIELFRVVYT